MNTAPPFNSVCPLPLQQHTRIQMAHGGGGKMMHALLEQIFLPAFGSDLNQQHDSAVLEKLNGRPAFTTDSYVVRPIIFPGGNIGSMAVHGTVNDLAMSGARPLYLSAGFILEEGLPIETLQEIVLSMREAALRCGVRIVTGDTKVIEKVHGDGLFINTAGIGVVEHPLTIAPASVCPGDIVIVNGDLGRHGMAIMSVREGLNFESTIESDSAPVSDLVSKLIAAGVEIHCLRDLTRGGLAAGLNEIATSAGVRIVLEENCVPVRDDVRAACEILGLDPLHVACEGRFIAFVAAKDGPLAMQIMSAHENGTRPAQIGSVTGSARPVVILQNALGARRILDMPSGEQLPRIC